MPVQPVTISPRFDQHLHPDGEGDGWNEHMRLINGRLYHFQHGYTAQGYATFRAYVRVTGNAVPITPEPLVNWQLIHELHTE
ncbi:hypothetical protein [Streptomyces sp. NPDC020965]|uniref:hypothetical protein n=1 Tax=Streptomyces sp. NPDC020965 TaxID=3365105 RepID=UPI0037B5E85B